MSRLSHLTWHVFSHLTSNTATCYRSWWMQPSPLPHVSPSHTVACQRCERGRPHRRCPPHDRRPWGRALITCIVQRRLCAQTSGPRSCADPGDHAERGGIPNALESDRRIALEERHCDGSSHLQVLRRFLPDLAFLSLDTPRFRKSECEICMRACVRKRSEAYCG